MVNPDVDDEYEDDDDYEDDEYEEDGDNLIAGPDERDRDLLDGSWEQRYYSGRQRSRDWRAIGVGITLLLLLGLLLPSLLIALG